MRAKRTASRSSKKDEMVCQLELRETSAALGLERLEARKFELETAIESFSKFYECSPVAFATFSHLARITRANEAMAQLLQIGRDRLVNAPFSTFVHEKNLAKFLNHLRECRRSTGRTVATELEMKRWRGDAVPVQLISVSVSAKEGQFFDTAVIDLSAQKAAAKALHQAWEYAEAIVLSLPYPVLVVDSLMRVVNANKAFYEVFYTHEDSVKNWVFSQLPDVYWETPGLDEVLVKAIRNEGSFPSDLCVRATLRTESTLVLHISARRLRPMGNSPEMLLVAFEDITRRKRIEDEREGMLAALQEARRELEARVEERTQQLASSLRRLREVSEQLMLAHESEQRRIARELHDQVGQDLTALRLMFNRAAKDEGNPARQTFADAEKVTEEAIQNVRSICSTLRPHVLDDVGLLAGLRTHISTFGARSNLQIDFEHNSFDEKRLSPILQSAVFRVIQEALTNVARHAETDRCSVVLWMTDSEVLFRIHDKGKGFRMDGPLPGHNGLSNMRERIALVNGHSEMKSRPGRGTTISVQIPLTTSSVQLPLTPNTHGKNHSS